MTKLEQARRETLDACDATHAAAEAVLASPWWRPWRTHRLVREMRRQRRVMRAAKERFDQVVLEVKEGVDA